jgi:hypothetical protein
MKSILPNFLIVGAPKCGTTSLASYLTQHREIFLPDTKPHISPPKTEPNFFVSDRTAMGVWPGKMRYNLAYTKLEDYLSLFSEVKDHKMIGEASPSYLYFYEQSIPAIKKLIGDAKIIIMIRDPVSRAFSSHLHHKRNNKEPYSFEQALLLETWRESKGMWYGYQLRKVGMYYAQIKAFLEAFTHVHVLDAHDLRFNRQYALKQVFRFLGVDEGQLIPNLEEKNTGKVPRVWKIENRLRHLERKHQNNYLLSQSAKIIRTLNHYTPRIDPNTARVLASDFADDVRKTSDLICRDLRPWLTKYNYDKL